MTGERLADQVAALAARIIGGRQQPQPFVRPEARTDPGPPTAEEIIEHLAAGGGVRPPVPPAVADAALGRLTGTTKQPPDPAVTFTVEPIDRGPFVPLHLREYRYQVDRMVAALPETAPGPGPFGVLLAASSVQLALAALNTATDQLQPHAPTAERTGVWTPDPDELVYLTALIADLHTRMGALTAQLQQQLVATYHATGRGEITGPPGSSPVDEVAGVMTTMIDTERALTEGARQSAIAAERLGRLSRVSRE